MQTYIKQTLNTLLAHIKNRNTKFLLSAFSVALVIILSFVLNWNRPPQKFTPRNSLPTTSQTDGVLTLITQPDQGTGPVLSLINNAEKSIDLVMYQLTDKEISNALINAHKRGLKVRVLLNLGYYGKQETQMNQVAYQYLTRGGVDVHWAPTYFALTHQKTMVIDENKALIMTWNFVPKYYSTGRDFGIIDTDPKDVRAISDTFSNDWNNKQSNPSLGADLVWSPNSESDILLIIKNAKNTLDIYNEEINSEKVTDALKEASARGVAIRLIMTYATANKLILQDLVANRIKVHTFSASSKNLYIHAKSIIADDNYAFLGSENFSFTSLNKNRELGIFIGNGNIVTSLENTFDLDWTNSKEFK